MIFRWLLGKRNRPLFIAVVFCLVAIIFAGALWNSRITKPHILVEGMEGNASSSPSDIPTTIWTFWDDIKMPVFVEKCIQSWTKFNPDHTVIVLNRSNVSTYLPDIDLEKIHGTNDNVQRFSDFVRIHILSTYGGFWFDASIICQAPITYIHDIQKQTGAEYIGFYIDKFTLPEYKSKSPVIENWCFGCVPNSTFMKDWRDEFTNLTKVNTPSTYVQSVRDQGVNLQNIDGVEYLAMHVAAQKILQTSPPNKYKLHLIRAEDTAFAHMVNDEGHWDDGAAHTRIIQKKRTNQPLLKIVGYVRNRILNEVQEYDNLFL